jgi:hypothetical protein
MFGRRVARHPETNHGLDHPFPKILRPNHARRPNPAQSGIKHSPSGQYSFRFNPVGYRYKQSSKSTKRAPKSFERTEKRLTFREATRLALDLYHETFRDLARYDREEKPLDTIPY